MAINLDNLLVHDVQRVFGGGADHAEQFLATLQHQAAQIFNQYEHTLNTPPTWIPRRWRRAVQLGYLTENELENYANNSLQWLAGNDPQVTPVGINVHDIQGASPRAQYLYLFSPEPNWGISRGRYIRDNLAGADEDGPDGRQINAGRLNAIIQQIIGLGGQNGGNPGDPDAAAQHIFNQNGAHFGKVSSVLLHLVWPHVFPVWFTGTSDGYSQVRGMRRILAAIGQNIGHPPVANFENNYGTYASAYRIVLWTYRIWLHQTNTQPPHFDFVTEMLANLEPHAVPGQLLETKKALILYGVPGTGKTHKALELAQGVVGAGHNDRIRTVQFHPGYSYADFVIGIRPVVNGGAVTYEAHRGVLYECAEQAARNPDQKFCLVIDEINRANLSEVLGEAMYCLEYRGPNVGIRLPQTLANPGPDDPFQGGQAFYIPENLYIIGTMNHADRSISGFDMALRRRFAWYKMEPMTWVGRKLAARNFALADIDVFLDAANDLNARIREGRVAPEANAARIPLNEDHQIGDSYFAAIDTIVEEAPGGDPGRDTQRHILPQHRERLWLYFIEPLLEDFLGSDAHAYREPLTELGQRFIGRD